MRRWEQTYLDRAEIAMGVCSAFRRHTKAHATPGAVARSLLLAQEAAPCADVDDATSTERQQTAAMAQLSPQNAATKTEWRKRNTSDVTPPAAEAACRLVRSPVLNRIHPNALPLPHLETRAIEPHFSART